MSSLSSAIAKRLGPITNSELPGMGTRPSLSRTAVVGRSSGSSELPQAIAAMLARMARMINTRSMFGILCISR